ncbi:MAG: hypothetical protein KG012_02005 [Deltaproteobacteria bacterium]|nr:hypothetical protein [Deltaproteobacteria bacterium]
MKTSTRYSQVLNLGARTNAILATYPFSGEKGKTFLLLIQYPDQKQAEKALQSFLKAYMPEAPSSKAVKTENGKWASARIHQKHVLVVFDAPSVEKTEQLIEAVVKKLPGR